MSSRNGQISNYLIMLSKIWIKLILSANVEGQLNILKDLWKLEKKFMFIAQLEFIVLLKLSPFFLFWQKIILLRVQSNLLNLDIPLLDQIHNLSVMPSKCFLGIILNQSLLKFDCKFLLSFLVNIFYKKFFLNEDFGLDNIF